MKELQHRVKNNLNVVTSLLELEDKKSLDSKAGMVLEDAIARIKSISAIYERLYLSEDLASVDLAAYVQDLAASLFSTYSLDLARVSLRVHADHVFLDTRRSVPLGLILNELLSNALKYAYPAPARGEDPRRPRPIGRRDQPEGLRRRRGNPRRVPRSGLRQHGDDPREDSDGPDRRVPRHRKPDGHPGKNYLHRVRRRRE